MIEDVDLVWEAPMLSERKPSDDDFEKIERRVGGDIPVKWRELIREKGGWSFYPNRLVAASLPVPAYVRFGPLVDWLSDTEGVEVLLDMLGDELPQGLLPVSIDSTGNVFLLDLNGGSILYMDRESSLLVPVASDLLDLVDRARWLEQNPVRRM